MFCRNRWNGAVIPFAGLLLVVASVVTPARVFGQVSGGDVSGSITDASGAVMPNVKVSLGDMATGVTRVVATDARGFYTAPDLPPDTYEMTVTAQGFVTQVRAGITVTVGAKLVLNITMQRGNPQQVVRQAAAVASQSSSAVSGNVSSSTVRNT
ncbi:MAG: carboxypeptidase-like regulatory domain-containing protein, partial [Terriglobia bacterium]